MPYLSLQAPNGLTVTLASTSSALIRQWFDEWLPQFTGWPGMEDTPWCILQVQAVLTPPSDECPDWRGDWPTDSRVTGDAIRLRAVSGRGALAELEEVREILTTTAAYLQAGGHPAWKCPGMSTEEIAARAPHPCLAAYMATHTEGGRQVRSVDDIAAALDILRRHWMSDLYRPKPGDFLPAQLRACWRCRLHLGRLLPGRHRLGCPAVGLPSDPDGRAASRPPRSRPGPDGE